MSIKRYDSDTKELNDVAGVYRLEGGGSTIEVDDELSTVSENPVKNRVITGELNKKLTEVSVMPQNPTDKQRVLFVGETAGEYVKGTIYEYSETQSKWNPISTAEIEVDDSLDSTSENPVQNKVIVSALGAKQPIQLVSAITLESHAYDTVPTALSAFATRLEDTYKKNQVDTAMNEKQPVQLVSAMILESNPYTTVPTALSALATRLGDTYTKNETDLKTAGLLNPKGTVTFVNLPTLAAAEVGDMYNVSNEFTTTSDFEEGAGEFIPAGANVYKTSGGKWDILAGSPVTGIKGEKEANYRRGNVNITAENVGAYTSGQVDTLLSGKQNLILSSPMMLESHSYNRTETALGALATRLENTYKKQEIDSDMDSLESKVTENRQTLGYTTKNLLKVTATSGSKNGITYIVNSDGSVFIPGGQTANTQTDIYLINKTNIIPGNYILSGCPNGGGSDTYLLYEEFSAQADFGDGKEMIIDGWVKVRIVIRANYTIPSGGLTFYPMIRPSEIEDDTFVPHQENVDYRLKEKDDYNLLEITAESETINGISYTIDKEAGTVFIAGRQTANAEVVITLNNTLSLSGNYILNGTPSGGTLTSYEMQTYVDKTYRDYGDGIEVPYAGGTYAVALIIRNGYTIPNSGLTFKPMIVSAEYKGIPFKPYKTPILREKYAEVYGAKNLFDGLFTSTEFILTGSTSYDTTVINRLTTSPNGFKYTTFGAYLPKGQYKLVDCTSLYLSINRIAMNGTTVTESYPMYSNGRTYDFTVNYSQWVYFTIERDTSPSDVEDINFDGTELKMMIVHASIKDNTYVPYARTNQQLTAEVTELADRNPVSWRNGMGIEDPDLHCVMYSPSSSFIESGSTYDGESPGGLSAGDPMGLYGVEADYIASKSQYSVNPMSFLQAKNHMSSVCYKATGTLEFLCQIGSVFFVLCNSQWALCARISTTKNASSVAVLLKSSGYDSEITLDWNAPNYQLISANNKVIRVNLLA